MKKVSVIFSYINCASCGIGAFSIAILAFLSFAGAGSNGMVQPEVAIGFGVGYLFLAAFLGVGCWYGIFFAKKVQNAYSKQDIQTLAIVTTIIYGFLPGLFALLAEDNEFPAYAKKRKVQAQAYANTQQQMNQQMVQQTQAPTNTKTITDQLVELKKLYDEGILTEEEYQSKRKDLVAKL